MIQPGISILRGAPERRYILLRRFAIPSSQKVVRLRVHGDVAENPHHAVNPAAKYAALGYDVLHSFC